MANKRSKMIFMVKVEGRRQRHKIFEFLRNDKDNDEQTLFMMMMTFLVHRVNFSINLRNVLEVNIT